MSDFPLYTVATAPEASRPALQSLQGLFGFIPNLAGKMAVSPVMIRGFLDLFRNVHGGTFSEAQIQTLLLTNAVTNRCEWAAAFHTVLALKEGLAEADVQAIRAGGVPRDAGLAALSALARTLIERRGRVDAGAVDTFLAAGYERQHVVEAIGVVAASTITNYVASVTQPPLEEAFQAHAWRA